MIDDLHWMDASSEPLVDRLLRTVADLPMTVFVTTRPTALPAWAGLDHVETITLDGLDAAGTERLAASIAGAELDDDTIARLHDRTAGNPLFVGETVRALLEDDALVTRGGRLHLRDAEGVGRVPVNLRALLGARIDGLPAGSRWILQVASVIGMTFEPTLVARLMGRSSVGGPLAALAAAAIVGPTDRATEWRFSHPLIRDVAYARPWVASPGAPRPARRSPRTARSAHPVGQLALHRAAAGDRERAVPLLDQAADAAVAMGATVEALGYWRMALDLLGDDPARRRSGRASPCSSRRAPRRCSVRRSRRRRRGAAPAEPPRPGSRASAPRWRGARAVEPTRSG